jgi:heavy metal translocating P-type ATPase
VVDGHESCALCGLRKSLPVSRTVGAETIRFCCEGCARVYEVARDSGLLDHVLDRTASRRRSVGSLVEPGETAYFTLRGMWCTGCATAAEALLRHQPGVRNADISFASERGRISYDPAKTSVTTILARLESLGYQARVVSDRAHARVEKRLEGILLQLIVAAAFGMQIMMLYLSLLYPRYGQGDYSSPEVRDLQYLAMGLTVPVLFVGGSSFLRGAWRALRAGTATMDTLVTLGTVSAFAYSAYVTLTGSGATYFDSVGMITTFVMVGRYLESLGGSRARRDLNALLTLQPDYAWTRTGDAWAKTDAAALETGSEVLVKTGERVPADGVVLSGAGALDESLLTGESLPVNKSAGELISAGTLLLDGALVARTTGTVSESRLAQISRLIEETLMAKPPMQRIADRASAYFVLGIILVAAVSLVVRLALGQAGSSPVLAAVAVLVVACPCALGLATPLALTISLSMAAGAGVIVRNPASLELGAKVERAVFDKTGTITRGRLTVESAVVIEQTGSVDQPSLLCAAAAVEQFSEHPLARAIVAACPGRVPEASDFASARGKGCSARLSSLSGALVKVGSPGFLGLDKEALLTASAPFTTRGRTVVWVTRDDEPLGFIVLRDELNPTAKAALADLAAKGIKTTILSGDNPDAVRSVSSEVAVDGYAAGLGPEEKVQQIRKWQQAGEIVAMVGDGVNDAPALAQADLAIAMAEGADLTGETADIVLTRADLRLVPWFIRLSARTRGDIRQNLFWAFAYNAVAIPLAAAGLISPIIASGAMAASSLLVVGNSLRLSRYRPQAGREPGPPGMLLKNEATAAKTRWPAR